MYLLPIIREVEDFSKFEQTSTYSQTNEGFSSSQSASSSLFTFIDGGTTSLVTNYTLFTTAGFTISSANTQDAVVSIEGGATRMANATLTSFTSSQGSFNSNSLGIQVNSTSTATTSFSTATTLTNSFTSSHKQTFFYQTTTEQPVTLVQTTTSDVDITLTRPVVSSGVLTDESYTTTVVGSTTSTSETTTVGFDETSDEFETYMEQGGVLVTEATDWVWSVTNFDSFAPYLISDLANSLAETTFWPETVSYPISYVGVETGYQHASGTVPANTTTYSWELTIFGDESNPVTITSGESLARTTTTVNAGSIDTTSSQITGGSESYTTFGTHSETITTTAIGYDNYAQTTLYGNGWFNDSTTELNALTSFTTTTTSKVMARTYFSKTSSANSLGTSEMGLTMGETDLLTRNVSLFPFGGIGQGIVRVAPNGAFVSPSDLRSAGNPYHFGTNLSFPGSVLPYNTLDNVFNNVQTPAPVAFTTTGDNTALTWRFAWTEDTLKITQSSTSLSGMHTVTHSTVTSGVFSPEGADSSSYFAGGGQVFGGYPYISSAAETVFFPPRAVIGTSNDDGGGSTTYKTIETASSFTTISENLIVENPIPAYSVWTDVGGGGLPNVLVYPRNPLP